MKVNKTRLNTKHTRLKKI